MFYATGLPGWMLTSAAPMPEQELAALKAQAESLKNQSRRDQPAHGGAGTKVACPLCGCSAPVFSGMLHPQE